MHLIITPKNTVGEKKNLTTEITKAWSKSDNASPEIPLFPPCPLGQRVVKNE